MVMCSVGTLDPHVYRVGFHVVRQKLHRGQFLGWGHILVMKQDETKVIQFASKPTHRIRTASKTPEVSVDGSSIVSREENGLNFLQDCLRWTHFGRGCNRSSDDRHQEEAELHLFPQHCRVHSVSAVAGIQNKPYIYILMVAEQTADYTKTRGV